MCQWILKYQIRNSLSVLCSHRLQITHLPIPQNHIKPTKRCWVGMALWDSVACIKVGTIHKLSKGVWCFALEVGML